MGTMPFVVLYCWMTAGDLGNTVWANGYALRAKAGQGLPATLYLTTEGRSSGIGLLAECGIFVFRHKGFVVTLEPS